MQSRIATTGPDDGPTVIDLNADLGEGADDDEQLLDVVTSANVACGFHAGDDRTMRRSCAAAVERSVRIGAHVSYLDREGFGRRPQDPAPGVLLGHLLSQLEALDEHAGAEGARVGYVKPHGALYNRCATDVEQSTVVVQAILRHDPDLAVLAMPGTVLARVATEAAVTVVAEAYVDRRYRSATALVPRGTGRGSLGAGEALAQARRLAAGQEIESETGWVRVAARSLCVHGDAPGAGELAVLVRQDLLRAGVELRAFA
jgi:UPF0271 protein